MNIKSYYVFSDKGPYVNLNEDICEIDIENNIFMIFDGFGGSGIGDKTVEMLADKIKYFYEKTHMDENKTLPFYYSNKYLLEGNALINAAIFANKFLIEENMQVEIIKRGGASGIIGVLSDNIITLLSTGNCLGLVRKRGDFSIISSPDCHSKFETVFHELKYKTFPFSGFGLFNELYYHVDEYKISEGDQIILLTDGIYNSFTLNEITNYAEVYNVDSEKLCNNLISIANERGNLDNQSMVVVKF